MAKSFPSSLPLHPRAEAGWRSQRNGGGRSRFFRVCGRFSNPCPCMQAAGLRSAFRVLHTYALTAACYSCLLSGNFDSKTERRVKRPFLKCFKILFYRLSFHVTGNACECGMQVVMQKKGWYICRPGSCVFANNINYALKSFFQS